MRRYISLIALVLWIPPLFAQTVEFGGEIRLAGPVEGMEFSRNPHGNLVIGPGGALQLAYSSPSPAGEEPSGIIHHLEYRDGGIPVFSRVNAESPGGRHPSIAVTADGTVHIAWQDSRHTTAAGNWIDNLEIYYSYKPEDGDFSGNEIRLTHTSAGHAGDNGFAPQIAVDREDRVHVTWIDFNLNGNNANVYLRSSGPGGEFEPVEGIDSFRLTQHDGANDFSSAWLPAIAFGGNRHYIVWGFLAGTAGMFELRGMFAGDAEAETISESGGRLLDPHRLAADARGTMGLVYPILNEDLTFGIEFRHRPAGGVWGPPLRVDSGERAASQPDAALDPNGFAWAVWTEDAGGVFEVMLAQIDTAGLEVLSRQVVSAPDADARTPVIAADPSNGRKTISWIDRRDPEGQAIYTVRERLANIEDWTMH